MLALVTGGSGFIGSHVTDRLMAHGVDVRIFDMVYPRHRKDIEYYHGSVTDLQSLQMAVMDVDAIFHLAAVADVKDVYSDPHYAEAINVRGTINVLEAARRGKIGRVIYGSTTWVYSDVLEAEVDENTSLRSPTHLYTAMKVASEHYCQAYAKLYNMDVTILRYGIPYGPRARDGAVIPIFVRRALGSQPLTIAGDGSQFRKFVYVEDLAEGNVLALKRIAANKIYNLDGQEQVTIRQIAETVRELIGNVAIEHVPQRTGDFGGKLVSSELAKRELGWEPKVSFREGVRRYVEWYREREARRAADLERLDKELQ